MPQRRQPFTSSLTASPEGATGFLQQPHDGQGGGTTNWGPHSGPGGAPSTGPVGEFALPQDFSGGWQAKGGQGGGGFTNWAAYLYANPLTNPTDLTGQQKHDGDPRTTGMFNLDQGLNQSYFGPPPVTPQPPPAAPLPAPPPAPAPGPAPQPLPIITPPQPNPTPWKHPPAPGPTPIVNPNNPNNTDPRNHPPKGRNPVINPNGPPHRGGFLGSLGAI